MTDAWKYATIESFEQVSVAGTVLLRVEASTSRSFTSDEARPTLVSDDGQVVNSFAAIPSPPDTDDLLRVAFAVPAAVVTADPVFSLEFPDFFVIALPAPSVAAVRASRVATPPSTSEPDGTDDTGEVDDGETRSELLHRYAAGAALNAEREAARDLAALETDAAAAGAAGLDDEPASDGDDDSFLVQLQAIESARDEAVRGRREAEAEAERVRARLAELEVWSAELERRLTVTTSELADVRRTRPGDGVLRALEEAASADAHAEAERDLAALVDAAG